MIIAVSSRALISVVILFAYSFLLLVTQSAVYSIPIPAFKLDIQDPTATPEQLRILRETEKSVNSRLADMSLVVNNPQHRGNRKILVKTFGENHNIKEIQRGVAKLHSSTIPIVSVNADTKYGSASTIRPDNTVALSETFFKHRNPSERTGTLIHEASHARLNTHDYFTNRGDPQKMKAISRKEAQELKAKAARKGRPEEHYVLSGYIDKDFNRLKEKAPHLTHHSADAYRVLSHYSSKGINTPLDRDREHGPPLINNKGVSDTSTATQPPSSPRIHDVRHEGGIQRLRSQDGPGHLTNHKGQSSLTHSLNMGTTTPHQHPSNWKGVPRKTSSTNVVPPSSPPPNQGGLPNLQAMTISPPRRAPSSSGRPAYHGRETRLTNQVGHGPTTLPRPPPNWKGVPLQTSSTHVIPPSSPPAKPPRGRLPDRRPMRAPRKTSTGSSSTLKSSPRRSSPDRSRKPSRKTSKTKPAAESSSHPVKAQGPSKLKKPAHPSNKKTNTKKSNPIISFAKKIASPFKRKPGRKK